MTNTKAKTKVVAPKSTTRVQLELPEKSMTRLTSLKEVTESSSYVEVIKNALRLYEDVIKETQEGKEILLKDSEGNVYPYRVFSL